MNELKLVVENGKLVADSREVADMIGKDHAHLCRDIAGYVEVIRQNPKLDSDGQTPSLGNDYQTSKLRADDFFIEGNYTAGTGKSYKCYKLTKQGCEMVANKLTGKKGILFTATYVQQFNDMERELSRPHDSYMIADPVKRALAWAEEEKVRQRQAKQIEEARPKALFADAVASSSTSILVRDLAKVLHQNGIKIGQNRMFDWLREHGYLIKSGSDKNMPTQKAMELKLFRIKEGTYIDSNGNNVTTKTPKITGKGQIYFVNKFLNTID